MKRKNTVIPIAIIAVLGLLNACVNLSQSSVSGGSQTQQGSKPGSLKAHYKKITPMETF